MLLPPAWLQRPLSEGQRLYAAADAACLLALLGSLVAAVGQPDEWPLEGMTAAVAGTAALVEKAEGAREAVEAAGEVEAALTAAEEAAAAAAAAGMATCLEEEAEAEEEVPLARVQRAAEPAPQQHVQQQDQQLPAGEGLLGTCSLQQLQAAAAAWGVRLEISGARAVKRSPKRSSRAKRQQQRQAGAGSPGPGGGFPLHVPWMDAQRQVGGWLGGRVGGLESVVHADTQICCGVHEGRQWQLHDGIAAQAAAQRPCYVPHLHACHPGIPHIATHCHTPLQLTGEPRFLCDVMVEGLARQLRLCGYDAGVCAHAWVCA